MNRASHEPFVEVRDPGYGPGLDPGDPDTAAVDIAVEGVLWAPLTPAIAAAGPLAFVDGVQRTEAWLTITTPDADGPVAGVVCAVGAGLVVAEPGRRARIAATRMRRLVIAAGDRALTLPSGGGFTWEARAGGEGDGAALAQRVGQARQGLERALVAEHADPERLLVLDGPLTYVRDIHEPMIGAVKSHQRMYLPADAAAIVPALAVGQRTPLFAIGEDRLSWYQRLPVADPRGWAGILRGEATRAGGLERAARLADRATAALPRYAGREHRDPRAPQNLQPIAGLEDRLRHLLGDRRLALRAVRRAARHAHIDARAVAVGVADPTTEDDR